MFDIVDSTKKIVKLFTRKDVLLILLLILVYFLTRLIFLDGFPIFSDEGIYIRWTKVAANDPAWRFISLTDGKQPLQTWGSIPFFKIFPENLLLAGRMFAVATGFFALTGMFVTLFYLFGKKAAYWGAFFYIFTPYFLFYDRLALVDSGVNAFFIWIFLLSIILIRTLRLDVALIFGLITGFGLLAKSSMQLFLGLSILAPILRIKEQKKNLIPFLINFLFLYGVGAALALLLYNVQRLSPFFHYIAEKNKTFILTPSEFMQNPFGLVRDNIVNLPLFVFWESGFVVATLGVLGLVYLARKDRALFYYLMLWIALPFIAIIFINKVLFPRYIIFFPTMLLFTAAYFVSTLKNKKTLLLTIALYVLSIAYFDYTIIADYKNIPLPPVDRGQYIEAWPAGWGVREIMTYARERSAKQQVTILGEGNFGMSYDVLDTFLQPNDKITIKGFWPLGEAELREQQSTLGTNTVLIVFSHRTEFPSEWPMKFINKYEKPGGKAAIYLYELTPQ